MRLILRLKSNKTIQQKDLYKKYYTSMHGFIYKKLSKTTSFKSLHSNKKYKPFSFSNLFPIKEGIVEEFSEDKKNYYYIIISSPLPLFIQELFFQFEDGEKINLGEFSFILEEKSIKNIFLKRNDLLMNVNPINITYKKDNKIIPITFEDPEYLDLLKKNLIKKYTFFSGENLSEEFNLFDNVLIKTYDKRKEKISIPIFFHNKEENKPFHIIGNLLEFHFNNISDKQLKIFQLCFDLGFGERNSYGFGFMIKKFKKIKR